jgi:signal transduction histidine kinase
LIVIVITDSIYDYMTLQDTYANGLQDIGWPVGYMLLGLAAQCIALAHARQTTLHETASSAATSQPAIIDNPLGKHSFLPYLLIPAVFALSVLTWRTGGNGVLIQGVYLGGLVLIGLLLVRQYFAIRETTFYNKALRITEQELHVKNQELSKANTRLEEQTAQVEEAYKQQVHLNELKDQFLLNVNHELRTPLTAIYGYLELLREYHKRIDSTMQMSLINQAVHGCEELQHLVSNVLDTIRGDIKEKAPTLEVFSIARVAHEVIDLFEPQKKLDYHIHLDIPETLFVRADEHYVHQVLLNLLSNAFKYSPKHTTVAVSGQLYDNSTVNGNIGSQVCISVQDAGLGIPPSEIPVLFGKFVRLKRDLVGSVRGTGLGLYISKQLVEAMEGNIWVESSGIAGQGSRFSFTLPSATPVTAEKESQTPYALGDLMPMTTASMASREEQSEVGRSIETDMLKSKQSTKE